MDNKNTSVVLTNDQTKFFREKRIKMSPFIRDLIDSSEEFKRWEDDKRE